MLLEKIKDIDLNEYLENSENEYYDYAYIKKAILNSKELLDNIVLDVSDFSKGVLYINASIDEYFNSVFQLKKIFFEKNYCKDASMETVMKGYCDWEPENHFIRDEVDIEKPMDKECGIYEYRYLAIYDMKEGIAAYGYDLDCAFVCALRDLYLIKCWFDLSHLEGMAIRNLGDELMTKADVARFIEKVDLKRQENELCDFSISKSAMLIYRTYYLRYSNYKWQMKKYEGSILDFYIQDEKDVDNSSLNSNYQGAYILYDKERDIALTADVITSIGYPFRRLAKCLCDETDDSIVENILSDKSEAFFERYGIDVSLRKYFISFALVYHWCGNTIPVPFKYSGEISGANKIHNFMSQFDTLRLVNFDDIDIKEIMLDYIRNNADNLNLVLPTAIVKQWENFPTHEVKGKLGYLFSNYLEDFERFMNKSFELNDQNAKEWLLVNTKYIIQRSFRIIKFFHGNWNSKRAIDCKQNLLRIFKEVFVEKAGLDAKDRALSRLI